MGTSIIGVALTGLHAAQSGLFTTGHNISNVNTPGYSRQTTQQNANVPQTTGAGYIGRGVQIETVRRAYDEFLVGQSWAAQASAGHWEAYATQLRAVDGLLGDPSAGLSPALASFFGAINDVAAHPSDAAARQGMVSGAASLAARFRTLDSQFGALRSGLDQKITSTVGLVNVLAARVADLNDRIALASGNGHTPNDLLDQRDAVIQDLTHNVRLSTVRQDDGSLNLFLANGQALVVGARAYGLSMTTDDTDPQRVAIGLQTGAGLLRFRSADLSGGELGGLLAFRESTLDGVQNELGRIAMVLADAANAQHALGLDANGQAGTALFSISAPRVASSSLNAGSGQLSAVVADVRALTASDYRVQWDGAQWNVTRSADGQLQSFATLPQTLDGLTLDLASGTPNAGDSFMVQPTRLAAGSFSSLLTHVSLIAAAAPIRTAALTANAGTAVISAGSAVSTDPNLMQPVTITFTGAATFDVSGTGTGNPTGLAYTPGAAISFNGWTVEITGAAAAGDVFTVRANTSASGDGRNVLALAGLQSGALVEGRATLAQAYGQLVSRVGNTSREVDVSVEAQSRFLAEAASRRSELSGVNLDEEAANLLRYQQAYQAAGKLIQLAERLFESLLSASR